MILLIRCDKEVKSYNKWTTTFNSDMSDVNDVFVSNGISTFLLYRSKLPNEFKKTSNPKRGISSISSLDFTKVEQDCIIFYHGDVLKEGDEVAIENLFNYCHNNNKHLVIQFSLDNQHMINHICTGSEVYVEREDLSRFLLQLHRNIKIDNLLG